MKNSKQNILNHLREIGVKEIDISIISPMIDCAILEGQTEQIKKDWESINQLITK